MALQHVPHELEDLILQHLRRDSVALKASTLACYRFAVVSQKLLFNNILLNFSDRCKSNTPTPTQKREPEGFLDFLENTPHIANSIRGIDIIADSYRLQTLDTTLLPCLSLLENLRHISLDTNSPRPIYWRYLSPAVHNSLYNIVHSHRLVTLRLRRIFEVPLSLLAECASLEALSLFSITFHQEDVLRILEGRWQLSPDEQRPRLRTLQLSISDDAFRILLNFLVGSNSLFDISMLAELSISIFSPRFDYANIHRLLHAVGYSLEIFCFSPITTGSLDVNAGVEQFPPLHLQLLPRLRIFRLRLVTSGTYTTFKSPSSLFVHQAYSIINQLKPEHMIEEITLKVTFPKDLGDFQEGAMAAWRGMDTTLSKIGALQKIILFVVQSDPLPNEMISWIKVVFPRANLKAILRVQATSSLAGFLGDANDNDLLREAFRRHDMV